MARAPRIRYNIAMSKAPPTRGLTMARGFRAAGVTCGIKPSGKPDLTLVAADAPCAAAGVFTTNKMPGEPVKLCKAHLRGGAAQAIVCNSGVSNVATGKAGYENAKTMAAHVANHLGCKTSEVLVCSTGVIGAPLPMEKIIAGIDMAVPQLASGADADAAAARAILTTDRVTKAAHQKFTLGGKAIHLGGIAKGSGMIAPNMATMLVFLTTDAAVTAPLLKSALRDAVNAPASFNRISVDHDTSTSDSLLILASGRAGNRLIDRTNKLYQQFADALAELCCDLAYQVLADGEGATRLFRVIVTGAKSAKDANRVGYTVVGSPLVKTAVHGADPNWGRLAMAVGRSGAAINPERLSLAIGAKGGKATAVLKRGVPVNPPQEKLDRAMRAKEVRFEIDLGLADGAAEWLGCDLSREYVAINADYTT